MQFSSYVNFKAKPSLTLYEIVLTGLLFFKNQCAKKDTYYLKKSAKKDTWHSAKKDTPSISLS